VHYRRTASDDYGEAAEAGLDDSQGFQEHILFPTDFQFAKSFGIFSMRDA
jgi:hypothetical protein